jgi:hypothetical protein
LKLISPLLRTGLTTSGKYGGKEANLDISDSKMAPDDHLLDDSSHCDGPVVFRWIPSEALGLSG